MVEVLACNIGTKPSICGLCLPGSSATLPCISLYADDTSLVVCSDLSICAVFSFFSFYKRGLRAKINCSKCKGLWLGSCNGCTESPVDTESSLEIVKILCFVGPGNVEEAHWSPRITVVENVLNYRR